MLIAAIIMLIAGVGCAIYGFIQNNSVEAQLESLLSNGSTDPGTTWIIIGAVVAVIGIVLLVLNSRKK